MSWLPLHRTVGWKSSRLMRLLTLARCRAAECCTTLAYSKLPIGVDVCKLTLKFLTHRMLVHGRLLVSILNNDVWISLHWTWHLCFDRTGTGYTGIFLMLSILFDRMRVEGVVDAFQTTKLLWWQRRGLVETSTEYAFCYATALEYLNLYEPLPINQMTAQTPSSTLS